MPMQNRLSNYLAEASYLKPLAERVARNAKLQQNYASVIPDNLARLSRVADFDGALLIIVAAGSATAAALRQRLPSLLTRLQTWEPKLSGIKIIVQVPDSYRILSSPRRAGETAQANLAQLRDQLPESPLRDAVDRLAAQISTSRSTM